MHYRRLSALFLLATACGAPLALDASDDPVASAPTSVPASSAAPPVVTTSVSVAPPPADPVADLARRFPKYDVLSIAPWRRALPDEDVVAVVVRDKSARGDRSDVSWIRASETGEVPAPRTLPLGLRKLAHLDGFDLDGDGTSELLLFGEGMWGSVTVLHLDAGVDQPRDLGAESAALDGCASVDEAKARLPLAEPLDASRLATLSTAAFLGRLAFQKPADLRAHLGAKGIELCTSARQSGEKWSTTCRTVRGPKLTEKDLDAEVIERLRNALSMSAMGFECGKTGDKRAREQCTSLLPGETSLTFELEGTGAHRRLARVFYRDANIGE